MASAGCAALLGGITLAGTLLYTALAAALDTGGIAEAAAPEEVDGIHPVLLDAYQRGPFVLHEDYPECSGMRWPILAGIGAVESSHADGADISSDGDTDPPIIGPRLDGTGAGGNLTPHPDTDDGRFDGDTDYDRAVGVTQHLPANWDRYGVDASNTGEADPHNVYDSVASTAVELCASAGGAAVDFSDRDQLANALFRYNPADSYVDDVLAAVDKYDALSVRVAETGDSSDAGQAAMEFALQQVGKPYLWGGTGPDAFDCSGLTQAAWSAAGVEIPRVTTDQYNNAGTRVELAEIQSGDLLFYDTSDIGGLGEAPTHVTLYAGDGRMVNAPSSGQTIRLDDIADPTYRSRFMGAVRPTG